MCIILLFIFLQISFSACKVVNPPVDLLTKNVITTSPSLFYNSILPALNKCDSSSQRLALADSIYYIAKSKKWIPIVFADTAVFLYKHGSTSPATIKVYGDMNGWSETNPPQISLSNYADTKLYYGIYKAPSTTTRVDYKLVVNGSWMLDPGNLKYAWGGFGSNSELSLSEYVYSDWVNVRSTGNKGTLSSNIKIHSDTLKYDVNYRVYLPNGYSANNKYPVIFTTDGQEYSDANLGAMNIIADNMIMDGKIKPIIIVFIDPRDPTNGSNRRMTELVNNPKYTHFLSTELYNQIKTNYSIVGTPEQTAILGTSLGGLNSAYTCILRPDVFGLLGIQSPAFWYYPQIMSMFANADKSLYKIYMDTGTIYDTQDKALEMKSIMEGKGYQIMYGEYSEGHSWGSWRARIDDLLFYFFRQSSVNV